MAEHGRVLAADLVALQKSGDGLKDMGAAHIHAAQLLAGIDCRSALTRDPIVGYGADGFYDAWVAVRSAVVAMLNANASNLDDCGRALDWVAIDLYEDADATAKADFTVLGGRLDG